jgi:hypothetical protein
MQQVKLFKSIESELDALEHEINAWVKESGARIVSVTGNIAPQTEITNHGGQSSFSASDVLVIILYEK